MAWAFVSKGHYIPIRYSRKYQVLVGSQAMDLLRSVNLPLQRGRSGIGPPGCQVELAGYPGHETQFPSTDSCAWQSARPATGKMMNLFNSITTSSQRSLRSMWQYQRSVALNMETISVQEQHKRSAVACQVQQVDCGTIDCTDSNHDGWSL